MVGQELEKMHINQKTNNESEILYKENDDEEVEHLKQTVSLKNLMDLENLVQVSNTQMELLTQKTVLNSN